MCVSRVALVFGEVLAEDDRNNLAEEILGGLSTVSTDLLHHLVETLPDLPDKWEELTLDGGIMLRKEIDNLSLLVAFRPSCQGVSSVLSHLLTPPSAPDITVNAVLVYAGLLSEGSGYWLLPNYLFTPLAFIDVLTNLVMTYPKPVDIENQPPYKHIYLHLGIAGVRSGGDWRQVLSRRFGSFSGHPIQLSLNGSSFASNHKSAAGDTDATTQPQQPQHTTTGFREFVEAIIADLPVPYCKPLTDPLTLRSSNDLTLRVSQPCLYVFPEGSGQSAIFALPGYCMLIDAGCGHRPCFWPVATHIDRIDSVFVTHWGLDNLLGLCSTLPVAFASVVDCSTQSNSTLCLLCPPPNPINASGLLESTVSRSSLCVNLPREVSKLIGRIKRYGANLLVYPLTRGAKMSAPAPAMHLYNKVGHGTLEMFVLTPGDDDSAELRKLTDEWSKGSPSLMSTCATVDKASSNKPSVPLLSYMSVSALVVWRPVLDSEPIRRMLFISPNAHQGRVLIALEAVVAANIFLRHQRAVPADVERKRPIQTTPRRSTIPTAGTHKPSGAVAATGNLSTFNAPKRPPLHTTKKSTTPHHSFATTTSTGKPEGLKTTSAIKAVPTTTRKQIATSDSLASPATSEPPQPENPDISRPNGSGIGFHNNQEHPLPDAAQLHPNASSDGVQNGSFPDSSSPVDPAHASEDVVTSWGVPQGLPPPMPPIGPSQTLSDSKAASQKRLTNAPRQPTSVRSIIRSNGSGPAASVKQTSGYTDASTLSSGAGSLKHTPYDKIKPLYVDVSFVPGGGNPHLVDAEWFKRVRAHFYVITDPMPSPLILESLVVGKESWSGEDAKLSVEVVFAHETEELKCWMLQNTDRCTACQVTVVAFANRSNIQLLSDATTGTESQPLTACGGYRIDL